MRTVMFIGTALLLVGCFRTAEDFANTPSPKLCIDYLNSDALNFERDAMEQALARRNEDCSAYVGAAADFKAIEEQSRAARSQNLLGSGLNLLEMGSPQYRAPASPTTHTYIINGRMVTCTQSGSITNCF
jgi:hypothetical protein